MKNTNNPISLITGLCVAVTGIFLIVYHGLKDSKYVTLQGVYVFKSEDSILPDKVHAQASGSKEQNGTNGRSLSKFVTEADISNFQTGLPQTLADFKNPCWVETVAENFSYYTNNLYYEYHKAYPDYSRDSHWDERYAEMQKLIDERKNNSSGKPAWRMRCFPYFFLIGFTKCGTTDLHYMFTFLPGYFKALTKECEFWNNILVAYNNSEAENIWLPKPTLSGYLDLFDLAAEGIRNYTITDENNTVYHPGITGDFDPQTIWRITKWRQMKGNENAFEPNYLPAHEIYRVRPSSKFIVVLRNPVERTFSYYKFFAPKDVPFDPEVFHRDTKDTIRKLEFCFKERSVRSCAYLALIPRYIGRVLLTEAIIGSVYHVFIEDWLKVFPREQFLFIKSEEYFRNRTAAILDIMKFLEMGNSIPLDLYRRMQKAPAINRSNQLKMLNKTRALLQKFFRPRNEKLFALLRDERFLWR